MANLPIWRILVLVRDSDDPKWVLATVQPGDVHPAQVDPDGSIDLDAGQRWAREQVGTRGAEFEQLPPRSLGWHIR